VLRATLFTFRNGLYKHLELLSCIEFGTRKSTLIPNARQVTPFSNALAMRFQVLLVLGNMRVAVGGVCGGGAGGYFLGMIVMWIF